MLDVIVCGYKWDATLPRCIASLDMQTMTDFIVTFSADSDDDREYLLQNTVQVIKENHKFGHPENIIVCVDADDFLIDEDAFKIISDAYAADPNLLLTYGSYVSLSTNERGKFNGTYLPTESFRESPWRLTHLKTFKRKLFNKIPESCFLDENGEYFKCCADRAMMLPMAEMAGHDRIKHIDALAYCYNDENPISVWKTNRELSKKTREYIHKQPPLQRVEF